MKVELSVTGLEELEKNLLALGTDLAEKTLRNATRDAAKVFRDEAAKNAPVGDVERESPKKWQSRKPGSLRAGIKISMQRNFKKAAVTMVVRHSAKTFYGKFVEFGTKHMPAKPFMRPALQSEFERAKTVFVERLKERIKKAEKKKAKQK